MSRFRFWPAFWVAANATLTASLAAMTVLRDAAVASLAVATTSLSLSVSFVHIDDQLTLAPITFNTTVSGGTGPFSYLWSVRGLTTGLSSFTVLNPTFTPYTSGAHTAVCQVTDSLGNVRRYEQTFTVGDADGFLYYFIDFSDPAYDGHDFKVAGGLTVGGLGWGYGGSGGAACPVGNLMITGGKLKIQTTAAHGDLGIGYGANPTNILFGGVEPVDFGVGCTFDNNITADSDELYVAFSSGTVSVSRVGGVQKVGATNVTPTTGTATTSGGLASRALEHRVIGRYVFTAQYAQSALTKTTIPRVGSMLRYGAPPSGLMTHASLPPGTGADSTNKATTWTALCGKANNNRAYYITLLWIRWKPGPL